MTSIQHNQRLIETLNRFEGSTDTQSPRGELARCDELGRGREALEECALARKREDTVCEAQRLRAVERAKLNGNWDQELGEYCSSEEVSLLKKRAELESDMTFDRKQEIFLLRSTDLLVREDSQALRRELEAL